MEINFFFFFGTGLSTRVTIIFPAVHLVQKGGDNFTINGGGFTTLL